MHSNEILLNTEQIIIQNVFLNIFSIYIHTENFVYPVNYVTLITLE